MSPDPAGPVTTYPSGWYETPYGWQWWDGYRWLPPAPPGGGTDEKTLACLSHLGPFFGGFVLPLVMFFVAKDKPFVRHHACEALNFAITHFIVQMAAFAVLVVGLVAGGSLDDGENGAVPVAFVVGFAAIFALTIVSWVFAVMGAVKASRMEWWRYPVNLRLVKP